jgi:beta-glucosidase/6-phospho-beta-glucosidase/beta-galactosidase
MSGTLSTPPDRGGPSGSLLPPGFRFGVATAGFQVEGGYNGPGEPANNWLAWERAGRVEPSGIALDFWRRAEEQLEKVAALGCDTFRLSVEWARVEPAPGELDEAALARYRQILLACAERGLTPVVTLHHFTHPAWLGEGFWLDPAAPERFAEWAEAAVARLGEHCRHWVTLNEPNVVAFGSYLLGLFPPGRRDLRAALAALDHLLAGHLLACGRIRRRQPEAWVTTNTAAASVHEVDRLGLDLLLADPADLDPGRFPDWLAAARAAWDALVPPPDPVDRWFRRLVRRRFEGPLRSGLSATVAARRQDPELRALDAVGVDYYNPYLSRHLRLPGQPTAGGRSWSISRPLWDDVVDPAGLLVFCRAAAATGLPVWIVENGLASRVRRGRAFPRLDGWDRPRYLRAMLGAVLAGLAEGLPIEAYLHWTLADNYEWGSYEPRFGLFGVDRERGLRWSEHDSLGQDAAGTYARIIAGLRAGDPSVVDRLASAR